MAKATDSLYAFSSLGPGTFRELAASLAQAGAALSLANPPAPAAQGFLDEPGWAKLLDRAGFSQVQVKRDLVTTSYPSVPVFLKSLQGTGATNPEPRPLSPRLLKSVIAAYQAEKVKESKEAAALDARTGRVICIGVAVDEGNEAVIYDDTEKGTLTAWWQHFHDMRKADPLRRWVGHNIAAFDLPYLVRRSWINGVSIPCTTK